MIISMSQKQNLNGRISTESELIAVDDAMAQVQWTEYFIQSQGYQTGPSTTYQDNMSTILLEVNGKGSTSKQTKHIKAQYYLIKDKVNSGEAMVRYCPKDEMWADVFTKPLQGTEYKKFRRHMIIPLECYNKMPFAMKPTSIGK